MTYKYKARINQMKNETNVADKEKTNVLKSSLIIITAICGAVVGIVTLAVMMI